MLKSGLLFYSVKALNAYFWHKYGISKKQSISHLKRGRPTYYLHTYFQNETIKFPKFNFNNLILKEYVSTLQWKLIENVKGSNGALLELGFTKDFRVQKRPKKLKGWKKVQKISFQIWTPWWLQFTSTFLSPKTWETSAAFGTATKECWWCPLKASHGLHGRLSNIVSIKMSSNKKLCLIFREEEEITVPLRHMEL